MKESNSEQIGFILGQIKSLEIQHPKAQVYYDVEENRVIVEYPLPADFYNIRNILIK